MISAFLREFVLPLLLILLLRSFLGGLFSSRRKPARRPASNQPPAPPKHAGGTLYKDPVCGTYVSGDSAVTLTLNGETLYFCSRECWDKYHAR
jgi:YHS domain-containing protein